MKWRVVELETHDAFLNMALDQAVSESVLAGNSPPTIRLYKWKPSAVSIGYFQSMNDEVDVQKCDELGIDYIRRRTGGGAVYHDNKGEITYSVVVPEQNFPKDIRESYKIICGWIVDGLSRIGIKANFIPINDIVVNGRKISGNAQTRRGGILLQHGTILYDLDVKTMFSVLKISAEKISDKMIKSVEERVTRVLNHTNVSQEELCKALLQGFTNGKEYETGEWSSEEMNRAKKLAKEVYCTREWNFRR
jgi:lipoate-protein ligase A